MNVEELYEENQQLKAENADLAQQLAIANDWLSHYEEPYR